MQNKYEETPYDSLANRQQILIPSCQQESGLRNIYGHMCPSGHIQPLSNIKASGLLQEILGVFAGVLRHIPMRYHLGSKDLSSQD